MDTTVREQDMYLRWWEMVFDVCEKHPRFANNCSAE